MIRYSWFSRGSSIGLGVFGVVFTFVLLSLVATVVATLVVDVSAVGDCCRFGVVFAELANLANLLALTSSALDMVSFLNSISFLTKWDNTDSNGWGSGIS